MCPSLCHFIFERRCLIQQRTLACPHDALTLGSNLPITPVHQQTRLIIFLKKNQGVPVYTHIGKKEENGKNGTKGSHLQTSPRLHQTSLDTQKCGVNAQMSSNATSKLAENRVTTTGEQEADVAL